MPGQGVQLQNSGTGRDGGSGLVSLCEVYKQVEHGEVGVATISWPSARRGCDWAVTMSAKQEVDEYLMTISLDGSR